MSSPLRYATAAATAVKRSPKCPVWTAVVVDHGLGISSLFAFREMREPGLIADTPEPAARLRVSLARVHIPQNADHNLLAA